MLKQVFVAAVLMMLTALGGTAQAQTAAFAPLQQLVEWTDSVLAANAPVEAGRQGMLQIVRAIQAGSTPEERGAVLIAAGPQISAALAQTRQGMTALGLQQSFVSGDSEFDAMAAAAHQALRTNAANVEQLLLGIEQMHLAAARGDSAGVQRSARVLLPFPAAMLRSSAASYRLIALQSRSDLTIYHFLQARAAFSEAGAFVADITVPIDLEAFESRITDAMNAIAIGRVSLAADQELLLTPGLSNEQRAIVAELLDVQGRSYDLIERAVTSTDETVARMGQAATPEQRLAALREAGQAERELAPLTLRASALAAQMVR